MLGADEPRYAQVAREMWTRGDWVTPTLGGQVWFEKPALVYWTEMLAFSVFGVSEWSARLGVAIGGWLTVLLVGWTAGRVEQVEGGVELRGLQLTCAGVLASCSGLIVFSRAVNFDVMIMATITLALVCFMRAELAAPSSRRQWWMIGFYAGMGLSLLAKGLIGVVLPAGVVGLYYLLRRRRPTLWQLAPWGLLLTAAVAAVWYAPAAARHGWKFIDEFIVQHHFARYTSNKYQHPQRFYFYLPIMLLLVLPWTAFFISALWRVRSWDWRADGAAAKFRLLSLAWLLVPIGFFSLSGSKLPGYILPALPGAALLVGDEVARFQRGEGNLWVMRATGVLILALALAGLAFAFQTGAIGRLCALAIVVPPLIAGSVALIAARRRVLCVAVIVGAGLLTPVLIGACALESLARRESVRELLQTADSRGYSESPIVNLHTIERTAEYYAAGRLRYESSGHPVKFEGVYQVVEEIRRSGRPVLVFVPPEFLDQLTNDPRLKTEMLGDNGSVALVAASSR